MKYKIPFVMALLPVLVVPVAIDGLAGRPDSELLNHPPVVWVATVQPGQLFPSSAKLVAETNAARRQA